MAHGSPLRLWPMAAAPLQAALRGGALRATRGAAFGGCSHNRRQCERHAAQAETHGRAIAGAPLRASAGARMSVDARVAVTQASGTGVLDLPAALVFIQSDVVTNAKLTRHCE